MQGSSRAALAAGHERLDATVGKGANAAVDALRLADDLFAVCAVLDSSATLRRALTDPGREADARGALTASLFGGKVSATALDVVKELAGARWSRSGDLPDAVESLAISAAVISADADSTLGALEDELFRFERTVDGNQDLRAAFSDHRGDGVPKADLVEQLLQGKATKQTIRLARQAVLAPRGRRIGASLELTCPPRRPGASSRWPTPPSPRR